MKKIIILVVIFLPSYLFSESAKIISISGDVEYRTNQNLEWKKATPDIEIPEGGTIRTNEGIAFIKIGDKSKVWINKNTALEIEQGQNLISRLTLFFGKIKIRVEHLRRKEKFELRTPTAVCAVRGTEFVVESDEEGRMSLNVLYGEVKLNHLITPQKGDKEVIITQGQYFKIAEKDKPGIKELMDKKQEIDGLQKWDPGLSKEERIADIKQKEIDRLQIRDFSKQAQKTDDMVKSFIYRGRDADLEAGRTLRDIHGNLVRVDQRLIRPDPSTLQFFNIVKRPVYGDYQYTNSIAQQYGFKYNGGTVENRMDLLLFTMNFNKDLPQSITEWPSFFNKNSVKANWATFISANKTYDDEIFFIGEGYKYDPVRDELVNNTRVVDIDVTQNKYDYDVLLAGIIKDDNINNITAFRGLSEISKLNIKDAGTNNGKMKYKEGDIINKDIGGNVIWALRQNPDLGGTGISSFETTGDPYLYQYKGDAYYIGGQTTNDKIWLAQENYVISNGGSIKKTEDFTNSSSDPFSILKNSAGESIMYIKKANPTSGDINKVDDYFTGLNYINGTNIDLVIIPDLAIAGVQKVLPALNELKK